MQQVGVALQPLQTTESRAEKVRAIKQRLYTGWRHDKDVLDEYVSYAILNWKIYAGPRTQQNVADLYGLYQQIHEGDCNEPKPVQDWQIAKWEAWSRLRGTTQLEAKRRFITYLAEIDPTLLEVTPSERPPPGFMKTRAGEPICAKCNTVVGCSRPLLDKDGNVLRTVLLEDESLHDPLAIRAWISRMLDEQRCIFGLHRPVPEREANMFTDWFNRLENGGYKPYEAGELLSLLRDLVIRQFEVLRDMNEHKDEYSSGALMTQIEKTLKIKSYYRDLTGQDFEYEVACDRLDNDHCNRRRHADGHNHTHVLEFEMPTADFTSFHEIVELRKECQRLGLSPQTGPVENMTQRANTLRERIDTYHANRKAEAEARERNLQRLVTHARHKRTIKAASTAQRLATMNAALDHGTLDEILAILETEPPPEKTKSGKAKARTAQPRSQSRHSNALSAFDGEDDDGKQDGDSTASIGDNEETAVAKRPATPQAAYLTHVNTESPLSRLTPLMRAVLERNQEAIRALVDVHGADIDYVNADGMSATMWAVRRRDSVILHLLSELGADLSHGSSKGGTGGLTPLIVAARYACEDAVELMMDLIRDKAQSTATVRNFVNQQNAIGETALHVAARYRNALMCRQLVREGVDAKITNNNGQTAAFVATAAGWLDLGDWLNTKALAGEAQTYADMVLTQKTRVESTNLVENLTKFSVLFRLGVLCEAGIYDEEALEEAERRAAEEAQKKAELDALAARRRRGSQERDTHPNETKVLHRRNSSMALTSTELSALDRRDPCDLKMSKRSSDKLHESFKLAFENAVSGFAYPDTEVKSPDIGWTTFLAAVVSGQSPTTIINLLRAGANVNYRNRDGVTPLMMAAKMDRIQLVATLLEMGAEVELKDIAGRTAMHYAAEARIDHAATGVASESVSDLHNMEHLLALCIEDLSMRANREISISELLVVARRHNNREAVRRYNDFLARPTLEKDINDFPLRIRHRAEEEVDTTAFHTSEDIACRKLSHYMESYRWRVVPEEETKQLALTMSSDAQVKTLRAKVIRCCICTLALPCAHFRTQEQLEECLRYEAIYGFKKMPGDHVPDEKLRVRKKKKDKYQLTQRARRRITRATVEAPRTGSDLLHDLDLAERNSGVRVDEWNAYRYNAKVYRYNQDMREQHAELRLEQQRQEEEAAEAAREAAEKAAAERAKQQRLQEQREAEEAARLAEAEAAALAEQEAQGEAAQLLVLQLAAKVDQDRQAGREDRGDGRELDQPPPPTQVSPAAELAEHRREEKEALQLQLQDGTAVASGAEADMTMVPPGEATMPSVAAPAVLKREGSSRRSKKRVRFSLPTNGDNEQTAEVANAAAAAAATGAASSNAPPAAPSKADAS